jgi:hypothetical protein
MFPETSPHPTVLPGFRTENRVSGRQKVKKKQTKGVLVIDGWVDGRLTGEHGISPLPSFPFHGSIQTCHLVQSSSSRLVVVVVVTCSTVQRMASDLLVILFMNCPCQYIKFLIGQLSDLYVAAFRDQSFNLMMFRD